VDGAPLTSPATVRGAPLTPPAAGPAQVPTADRASPFTPLLTLHGAPLTSPAIPHGAPLTPPPGGPALLPTADRASPFTPLATRFTTLASPHAAPFSTPATVRDALDTPPAIPRSALFTTLATVRGAACGDLDWTGPIPVETARRIACDSTVTGLLLDPEGQPLRAGRTQRLVTRAQRVALAQRDGGCIYPGCRRPARWCDAHHVRHWADGGPTDLDNLCLLCRYHHRLVHERGYRVVRTDAGSYTVDAPHTRRVPYCRRH
jgi:hypothetical protein